MLILYVTWPWSKFYKKGMKTWEIRSYPINYRGEICIVDNKTNTIISKLDLVDCIPLNKERWEMNFEKHRTSCSYENLPYRNTNSPGYAWVLKNPQGIEETFTIERPNKKPYHFLDDMTFNDCTFYPINFKSERLACKFVGSQMLIYWLKKNYFALVAVSELSTNKTILVENEISESEVEYILSQIVV